MGTAYFSSRLIMPSLELSSFITKGFLLGMLLVIYKFIGFLSFVVISCAMV